MNNLICLKNKGIFTCDICGKVLKGRKEMQNHLRLQHVRKVIAAYCCNKCDLKFVFNAELFQHNLKVHYEGEKFGCECGKFYRAKGKFNECLASHKGSGFSCEVELIQNTVFDLIKTLFFQ